MKFELDNLIFVVNCNLQRLDGPVRGNGKIISELESLFRGSGWNVIKCLWGSDWDPLFAKDKSGRLIQLMNECVDGEYQSFKAKGGAYVRKEFFGQYPETAWLVEDMTDEQVAGLHRGGHDPVKVYNAYKAAVEHKGGPTVVLAKTVKGYGMGDAGEARNPTHQNKKLNEKAIEYFRARFEIPIPDEAARDGALYRPPESSPEMAYMHERRRVLGGYLPMRKPAPSQTKAPAGGVHGRVLPGFERAPSFDHDGVRQTADEADEASRIWQAGRSHRSRRSAHVRHGIDVPNLRDLRRGRPALQAARCGHPALLQGSEGRPDSRRGNYGSRVRWRNSPPPAPRTRITASI